MKYLFVSPERVIEQHYRYGFVFRFAGLLVILGFIVQAPILLFSVNVWRDREREIAEQTSLRTEMKDLEASAAPLKEIKQKLAQIHQWEPILRNRLPVSALLSAVQNAIPQSAVLDFLTIESEQYDRQPVPGGIYRTPSSYRVILQGLENQEGGDAKFNEALLGRMPTGSEMIRSERLDKRADGLIPFTLLYSVKPTGNYFGLGIKKIAEPDTL